MKKNSILFLLIAVVFCGTSFAAQRDTLLYYQNFESGSPYTYTPHNASINGTHNVSPVQCILLKTSSTDDSWVEMGPFRIPAKYKFGFVDFSHICKLAPADFSGDAGGAIQYSFGDKTNWSTLGRDEYIIRNKQGASGFTGNFRSTSYPGSYAVGGWDDLNNTTPPNNCWKNERFNFSGRLSFGDPDQEKVLYIRFYIPKYRTPNTTNPRPLEDFYGWLIDNIKITVSEYEMDEPKITMINYPDPLLYPSSNTVKIRAKVTDVNGASTTHSTTSGIAPDSVYINYKVGNNSVWHTSIGYMAPGTAKKDSIYEIPIPFYGYDTLITWRLTAVDSSLNFNRVTFPYWDTGACLQYKAVRGFVHTDTLLQHPMSAQNSIFSPVRKGRFQYIYDSAFLKQKGFKAGNVAGISFLMGKTPETPNLAIENFTIKMMNLKASSKFTTEYVNSSDLRTVFSDRVDFKKYKDQWVDISFSANDAFKWNGEGDILIQICYDSTSVSTSTDGQNSLYNLMTFRAESTAIESPYTTALNDPCNTTMGTVKDYKPVVIFKMGANYPSMQYDVGVLAIKSPTESIPASVPTKVEVELKNYGTATIDSVAIFYVIDGNYPPKRVFWKGGGLLQGNTAVADLGNVTFTTGFKTIEAWTGGWVNESIQDYEPLNDTARSKLTACGAPLRGDRYIGGTKEPSLTYNNFSEAFDILRNCNIDSNVTFFVQGKDWATQLDFPAISGLENHTITFRPQNLNETVRIKYSINEQSRNWLVDLHRVSNIIFKHITFEVDQNDTKFTDIISFGQGSNGIVFDSCNFIFTSSNMPQSVISLGASSNAKIVNSTFTGRATTILSILGLSGNYAKNNVVSKNTMIIDGLTENIINAEYQKNVKITQNKIRSTSQKDNGYAIRVSNCSDSVEVSKNEITLTYQSGILISDLVGGVNRSALVANNMISLTGKKNRYGIDLLKASNLKLVYNSISIDTGNREIPIALSVGNLDITSEIKNNIFANYSGGCAISLSSNSVSFGLDYNSYYSTGYFGGIKTVYYNDTNVWRAITGADTHSMIVDPLFAPSQKNLLTTIMLPLSAGGTHIAEVNDDMNGTPRPATNPSLGALQFGAPEQSAAVLGLVSPLEGCSLSTGEKISVKVKNVGSASFGSGLLVYYQIGTQIIGPEAGPVLGVNEEKNYTFNIAANLSVANIRKDSVFKIKIWCSLGGDNYQRDDTIVASIISHYQLPKPTVFHALEVDYGQNDTLRVLPTANVATYWYRDSLVPSTDYLLKGDTLIVFGEKDTTFYASQKVEQPMLRFTELQLQAGVSGATLNPPLYLNSSNRVLELANLGNSDISLKGYYVVLNENNPIYLSDVVLKGGAVFTIQTNSPPPNLNYPYTMLGSFSMTVTNPYTLRLFDPHGVLVDAFKINAGSSVFVPSTFWEGTFALPAGCSGIRRINPYATDSSGWVICNVQNNATIGSIEDNMIAYKDNGCSGERMRVDVKVKQVPDQELSLDSIFLSNEELCNLRNENISIVIHNHGKLATNAVIPVKYYVNGILKGNEVVAQSTISIQPNAEYSYTFNTKVDLFTRVDTQYTIMAIVSYPSDVYHENDTIRKTINMYKSAYFLNDTTLEVGYGTAPLLELSNNSNEDKYIWYDWNKTPLNDTNAGFYKVPFKLFTDTSYYVKPIVVYPYTRGYVGTATSYNQPNEYPAVYSSKNKFTRHQIIVTANELRSMGYFKGNLNSISFYIDSLPAGGVDLNEFTIAIGKTNSDRFSGVTYLPLGSNDSVYCTGSVSFRNTGWYEHKLSKPFYWDGVENLIIQTNTKGTDTGRFVRMRYTTTNLQTVNSRYGNDSAGVINSTGGVIISQKRNNMRFGFSTYGCVADEYTEVRTKLKNIPEYDLELLEVVAPAKNSSSGSTSDITVAIRNNGSDVARQAALSLYVNSIKVSSVVLPFSASIGLLRGEIDTVTVAVNYTNFSMSGSDTIKVILDSISSNYPVFVKQNDLYPETDTVSKIISFCLPGGTYTIGNVIGKAAPDYENFTDAVKALVESGICGSVIFKVREKEYEEQISIPYIYGASLSNTILFCSENGDSSKVILKFKPTTVNTNYVLQLDNANYISFKGITIYADTSSALKTARAVVVKGDSVKNISFTSNKIEVTDRAIRLAADTTQTNTVHVEANISGFIFENNRIIGGVQALFVKPKTATFIIDGVSIKKNRFENFLIDGTALTNVRKAVVSENYYDSKGGAQTNLTRQASIILIQPVENFRIEKNIITMNTELPNSSRKIGIQISNSITGVPPVQNSLIANNMISLITSGGTSSVMLGMNLGKSSNIKVLYNTILLKPRVDSLQQMASRCFYSDDNREIIIRNNNFQLMNLRGGAFVMEVTKGDIEILDCDYNNYYCSSSGSSTAKWGYTNCTRLADLIANTDGATNVNSVEIQTDFLNDINDLHLKSPDLAGKARADNDVLDDIDGFERPKSINPTIGAHEKSRTPYDVGVIAILSPNQFTTEYDGSLISSVRVTIKNFGTQAITPLDSLRVFGYISSTMKTDTLLLIDLGPNQQMDVNLPRFMIPWQTTGNKFTLTAYTAMPKDTVVTNDTLKTGMFQIVTSYDLTMVNTLRNRVNASGCGLFEAEFGLKIKNEGGRTILATEPIKVGLIVQDKDGNVRTKFDETAYLQLVSGATDEYYFKTLVNLYPSPNDGDIEEYKIKTFCNFKNDYNASNDTTNGYSGGGTPVGNVISILSVKTPPPPHGNPNRIVSIPYATIENLKAKQDVTFTNTNPNEIFWFASKGSYDTLGRGTSFSTPQLFADRVYYIQTRTKTPAPPNSCWSGYDSIMVQIMNRPQIDVGCVKVVEPFEVLTYMEKGDSVKVRIKNYGLQAVSNIPVTFRAKNLTTSNTKDSLFTEICEARIESGDTYDFTFKKNLFKTLYAATNYKFTVWTSLNGDNTALNDTVNLVRSSDDYLYPKSDTLRYIIAENRYDAFCMSKNPKVGLKITNVSYGLLNASTAPLANDFTLMNLQNGVNDTAAIFYKGYSDTMSISASYYDPYVVSGGDSAYIKVFIDWNRNAKFESSEMVFGSKIKVEKQMATVKQLVTIPETARTGFCRMRVILQMDADSYEVNPESSFRAGEREDYKIWIRPPHDVNLALEKVITPFDTLGGISVASTELPIDKPFETRSVKVLLRNLGTNPTTTATICWKYNNGETHTREYVTNLGLFQFDTVDLGEHDFPYGTTSFCAWLEHPNNHAFKGSDTIKKQFQRFHTFIFNYNDNFDTKDYFYAPVGGEYNPNIWQKGKPNKGNNWNSVVSEPNAWITDSVNTYRPNNESYLYSPYFYTGFVKPDSLIFEMAAQVAANAFLRVEYLSASNKWTSITDTARSATWYSKVMGFGDTIATGALNYSYTRKFVRMIRYESNVANYTQFRFVFRCEPSVVNLRNGFAIDNFRIVRAKQANDVGVIAILKPDSVSYGNKFGPLVRIQNFGTDTAYNIRIEYNCLGGTISYIPKKTVFDGVLGPDHYTDLSFTAEKDVFLVDKHFKDSLLLCAYTDMSNNDLYKDNDTTYKWVQLKLLEKDVGIDSKINPPDTVVIQSISDVIVRVHNYGAYPIQEIPITLYNENTKATIHEMVSLPDGREIQSNEVVEYTFKEKYQAFFGAGWLKIFTNLPGDEYNMNDTIRVKIYATNNVSDLVGEHIYMDEASNANNTTVTFAFMNKGDKKVNNIPVAYYIDNDPSTVIREIYTAVDVPANQIGYHIFNTRLPKRAEPYTICAFTDLLDENNRINDTTCNIMPINVDMVAAYMKIEEVDRDLAKCRIQFMAVNKGNYPVTSAKISISVDGGTQILQNTLINKHIVPGDTVRFTFDGDNKIAKKPNHNYSVIGSISTENDKIHINDTTKIYYVVSNIIPSDLAVDDPIIDVNEWNMLELAQNYPNPFENTTKIPFRIPNAGMVRFFVYDLMGKTIFENTGNYPEGEHIYTFKHKNLPSGIYYYGIEFNKERLVKKMVIL